MGGITSASIRQGAATMTLWSDRVPVSNVSLQFVVSGTPSQPQISMLVSAPNDGITTLARLSKLSI
jgi:hypothetical protein